MLQAGCTAADVDAETLPHGLATPLGVDPACGVVGLCLQGGVGPSPSVLQKQTHKHKQARRGLCGPAPLHAAG